MRRRNFIKQTGALAGGLLLHEQLLNAYGSRFNEKRISVGVIGCGDRGKGIMQVIQELNDKLFVKAVCDVLDFRIEEARKLDTATQF